MVIHRVRLLEIRSVTWRRVGNDHSGVSGTKRTTDLELLSSWMNSVPSIAPEVESLTMVFRVLELLPPLTAMTSAKELLGSNVAGSNTGLSGTLGRAVTAAVGNRTPRDGRFRGTV